MNAFAFWFPIITRRFAIRHIVNELRDVRTQYPNHKISVVAHSFGTYAITKILQKEPDINLYRLILCGSIVKKRYRWDSLARYPAGGVQNLCGTKDVWPVFAYALSWGYGPSGTFGFGTNRVNDAYFDSGHSGFFDAAFIQQFWLPFLENGTDVDPKTRRRTPPVVLSLLGAVPFLEIGLAIWLFTRINAKYGLISMLSSAFS